MMPAPHAIPAPPLVRIRAAVSRGRRTMRRDVALPVIHDRWSDDTTEWTPTIAPLVVPLALARVGETATVWCARYGASVVQLAGSWRGRVCFETSDDGAAWRPLALVAHVTGVPATEADRPGLWRVPCDAGVCSMRVRIGTLTDGVVSGCIAAAPSPAMAGSNDAAHTIDPAA